MPTVVIPILNRHYALLQRNLLYRGVTGGQLQYRQWQDNEGANHGLVERELELLSGKNGNPTDAEEQVASSDDLDDVPF